MHTSSAPHPSPHEDGENIAAAAHHQKDDSLVGPSALWHLSIRTAEVFVELSGLVALNNGGQCAVVSS